MQEQRYAGQDPFAWLVFGLQIQVGHIGGGASGAGLVDRALVHVPQILLILGDCLRYIDEVKLNRIRIQCSRIMEWNLVFEFMPTCASNETPQIRPRFADLRILAFARFAFPTHPNVDHRHGWVELLEARLHDDTLLYVPPGALHEDPMHAAAVARCRPAIYKIISDAATIIVAIDSHRSSPEPTKGGGCRC